MPSPLAWGPSTLTLLLLARSLLLIPALDGIRLLSPIMERESTEVSKLPGCVIQPSQRGS